MKIYEMQFDAQPETMVSNIRETIEGVGGSFSGDHTTGQLSIMGVVGNYTINGQSATVTITEKPIFIPWSIVDEKIRDFFS